MPFALAFGSFSFVAGFFSLAMVAWRGPMAPTPKNQLFEAQKAESATLAKHFKTISLYLTTSHFPNIGKPGTVYARGAAFTAFFAASPACESQSQGRGFSQAIACCRAEMCNPFGVQVLNNWWRSMQNKFIFGAPGPLPYRSSWPSQPAEAHFKPIQHILLPCKHVQTLLPRFDQSHHSLES